MAELHERFVALSAGTVLPQFSNQRARAIWTLLIESHTRPKVLESSPLEQLESTLRAHKLSERIAGIKAVMIKK